MSCVYAFLSSYIIVKSANHFQCDGNIILLDKNNQSVIIDKHTHTYTWYTEIQTNNTVHRTKHTNTIRMRVLYVYCTRVVLSNLTAETHSSDRQNHRDPGTFGRIRQTLLWTRKINWHDFTTCTATRAAQRGLPCRAVPCPRSNT